jgi:transposase
MGRPSKYSAELRRRAIDEVLERGRKISEVADQLGIGSDETLRKWVRQAEQDRGLTAGPTREELAEIKALRKAVADQQRTIESSRRRPLFSPWRPTRDSGDGRLRRRPSRPLAGGRHVPHDRSAGAHLLRVARPGGVSPLGHRR